MYTIHFTSGLGNQLFQFFFGESLKIKYPNIKILYKNSLLPPNQLRINDIFYSPIDRIFENGNNKKLIDYFQINLIRLTIKLNLNDFFNIYSDNTFLKKDISSNLVGNKTFYGYWQNFNYFNNNFDKIRNLLKFKKNISIKDFDDLKNFSEIVGVHYRGGDYKNIKNKILFHQVKQKYFEQNINKLLKILKKPIFVFFTDDYSSMNEIISNLQIPYFFVKDLSQNRVDDFQLLSQCNHYILPNSTFSLWAAYLNKNKNKIVFTPEHWFKNNKFNFEFYNNDWFSKI